MTALFARKEALAAASGQKPTIDVTLHLPETCRSNDRYRRKEKDARPFPSVGRNCGHKSSAWDTFNELRRSRILDGGAA
jgi:hypothetical protein